MTEVRSAIFLAGGIVVTTFFGLAVPLAGAFSTRAALWLAREWARWILRWTEIACGIRYEIEGREQINSVYEAEGYAPIAKTVGEIGFDDETVAQNAKDWGAKAGLLSFIENWLLLVGLVLGSILVAIGAYLLLKPAKAAAPDTATPPTARAARHT